METRFYLNYSEVLRLKKILGRFEDYFLHENHSELSLHVARKSLDVLSVPLADAAKTKDLIREILSLTQTLPPSREKSLRCIRAIKNLSTLYPLNENQNENQNNLSNPCPVNA